MQSESRETRAEILGFAEDAETRLQRIARRLQQRTFRFSPARGIAIPKKSNPAKKRPIVKAPVENRIVQRAILDVLQALPEIKARLQARRNFGGIAEIGVPDAIEAAYTAARRSRYFIRTDIKAFFDNIPRDRAVAKITKFTAQAEFDDLLKRATDTELDNLNQLGRDRDLFPLASFGVAQGSCLSPLLCNLLLEEFDDRMNGRGIVCVRYIDDFILFASDAAKAFKTLANAQKYLGTIHLDVYDPRTHSDKAEHGSVSGGFTFLGCEVSPERVRPSQESSRRLLSKIDAALKEAIGATGNPTNAVHAHNTYSDTLAKVSNTIRGWGNTYSFCTDDRLFQSIEGEIELRLSRFEQRYRRIVEKKRPRDRRRLLGVFLLEDCKKDDRIRKLIAAK